MQDLVDDIKSFFRHDDEQPSPSAHVNRPRPEIAPERPRTPIETEMATKALSGPVMSGYVRVVGLEEPAGEDANAKEREALILSSALAGDIRRNLNRGEILQQLSDTEFLILFSRSNQSDAEESLKRIVSDIKGTMHRRQPGVKVAVDRFVAMVDVEPNSSVDASIIYEYLRDNAPSLESRARDEEALALRRGRSFYMPFWSTSTFHLGINRLSIELPKELETRLTFDPEAEDAVQRLADRTIVRSSLDRESMRRGIRSIVEASASRGRPNIIVPIHASTLVQGDPIPFMKALAAGREEMVEHGIVEIVDVPTEKDEVEALARSTALLALARSGIKLVLRLELDGLLPLLRFSGVLHGASAFVPKGVRIEDVKDDIGRFAALSRRMGLVSYLSGVDNMLKAKAANERGIEWISGAAVHVRTEAPRPPIPFRSLTFRSNAA